MSSGGSSGGSTQKIEPPKWLEGHLKNIGNAAQGLYEADTTGYYGGPTVAGQSPASQKALELLEARAIGGNPLLGAAQNSALQTIQGGYLGSSPAQQFYGQVQGGFSGPPAGNTGIVPPGVGGNTGIVPPGRGQAPLAGQPPGGQPSTPWGQLGQTASGQFLNSNPYLDRTFDQASSAVERSFRRAVNPQIDSQFAGSGRYGSGAYQAAKADSQNELGNTLNNLSNTIYGNNYAQERQNQLAAQQGLSNFNLQSAGLADQAYGRERGYQQQAIGGAQGLADADYGDIEKLWGAGQSREGYNQKLIDADVAKFNYLKDLPYDRLARYAGIIQGQPQSYGTTKASTSNGGGSVIGNILGGLAGAAGIFGGFGGFGSN